MTPKAYRVTIPSDLRLNNIKRTKYAPEIKCLWYVRILAFLKEKAKKKKKANLLQMNKEDRIRMYKIRTHS
jgi:hypothetical protein